jgi:hypothetical protein
VHRPVVTTCPLPERNPPGSLGDADEGESDCERDDDCASDEYCILFTWYEHTWHGCVKPCVEDSDCGVGELCACEPHQRSVENASAPLGICRSATCTSDADCGPNSFCRAPLGLSCEAPRDSRPFACQTPADECSGENECPHPPFDDERACQSGEAGEPWVCGVRNECA